MLCDPVDCHPPGSSVHGIFQAKILEWVDIPSPGYLPDPGMESESPALQVDSLSLFLSLYLMCYNIAYVLCFVFFGQEAYGILAS